MELPRAAWRQGARVRGHRLLEGAGRGGLGGGAGTMDLKEYAVLLATKIEEAGKKGDRDEAIRLLRLLAKVANEEADKLAPTEAW